MIANSERHVLEVYGGRYIDYDDPQPESIELEDIAHALSQICRFGGHTRMFYSVAEHSLLVCDLISRGSAYRLAKHALMHDAHEAYLGDLPTPLKNALGPPYRAAVEKIDAAIGTALDLDEALFHDSAVRWADACALRLEAHALKHSTGLGDYWAPAWKEWGLDEVPEALLADWHPGLAPREAEAMFLARYRQLR